MYLVLFGLGLLVIAAGFLTIGFGIPINAFSLGNTLIVAGTIAVVGGLVVVGLAAALRQLNRIGEALNSRPLARPAAAVAADTANETLAPPAVRIPPAPAPAPARVTAPPKSPEFRPPEVNMPRPPEPRFPAAASESKSPLDWLRSKPKTGDAPPIAAEPPDVADEAPLSPRAPQRPMFSPPPFATSPVSEPPAEPKPWMPSRATAPEPAPKMDGPKLDMTPKPESPQPMAPRRSEPVARTAPQVERTRDAEAAKPEGKDAGLFDVVWPDARSKPMPAAQPAKREPEPMSPPPRDEVRAEKRAEPASDRVAILKSGVIDGMAYTLYADGSIEAELPQGTVRFASVDALRAHLEKSA